ncbi:MAG: NUDIX hydrolase, partial [Ilumatobacteraceae bacterium]
VHEAVELHAESRDLHDAGVIGSRLAKAMRVVADDLRGNAKPRAKAALSAVLACEDATRTPERMRTSIAGGGVVWRPVPTGEGVELVVVHRPRKGDWSLPKGRLRPGEDVAAGALREVEEETGLVCRCEDVVAASDYVDRRGRRKEVRFWAMRPVTIGRRVGNEVDEVRWLPLERAIDLVDKRRDREVLESFAAAAVGGPTADGSEEQG